MLSLFIISNYYFSLLDRKLIQFNVGIISAQSRRRETCFDYFIINYDDARIMIIIVDWQEIWSSPLFLIFIPHVNFNLNAAANEFR